MYRKDEIIEIIRNGENSFVEFKLEDAHNIKLAREIASFANVSGGLLIIGVDDDKNIVGISENKLEERIMNICYNIIEPPLIPLYYELTVNDKTIAVVEIEKGINKPYCVKNEGRKEYYIRFGSTNREATREQLLRLFQTSGMLHYEINPVPAASFEDLDYDKLKDYFYNYRKINISDLEQFELLNLLKNTDIMVEYGEQSAATLAGLLLFGKNPKKFYQGCGIKAIKINGNKFTDPVIDHKFFERNIFENIEDTMIFFKNNTRHGFEVTDLQRTDIVEYPARAIRELIVNAVAHRDYTISGSQISMIIYEDRIEIKSPGKIPNTLTIDKMKQGLSYHRNPVILQFLYDARYVERLGRGIPMVIEEVRKNNQPEPIFKEDGDEFIVTIYKKAVV